MPPSASTSSSEAGSRIFCAIDTTDLAVAESFARRLAGEIGGIKLGLEFFTALGPAGVEAVAASGLPVFLDLKFHDIPNTVSGAVRAAIKLRPAILTVHAGGGPAMLRAAAETAAEEAAKAGIPAPLVVAVTVLTSLDEADLKAAGLQGPVASLTARRAELAQAAGLGGIVCSPHEVADLRRRCHAEFKLVVPGIRPPGSAIGDQKRFLTPGEAVAQGADILVIGRPITAAPDPLAAIRSIVTDIAAQGLPNQGR